VRAVGIEAREGGEVAGEFGALRGLVRLIGEALHPGVNLGEVVGGGVGARLGGLGGHRSSLHRLRGRAGGDASPRGCYQAYQGVGKGSGGGGTVAASSSRVPW